MYDSDDSDFNEEEFIRRHLNFLIESDDEYNESSENSNKSNSYEGNSTIYGTSPISTKVHETWTSFSLGTIISSKEVPSKSWSLNNTNLSSSWRNSGFSSEDWYSHLSIEEIFFGQQLTANSRDLPRLYNSYADPNLYKIWNNSNVSRPQAFFKEKSSPPQQFFNLKTPVTQTQHNNSYSAYTNMAYKVWPYSNLPNPRQNIPTSKDVPLNYFNPSFNSRSPYEPRPHGYNNSSLPRVPLTVENYNYFTDWFTVYNNVQKLTQPWSVASYTPHHVCGAEEALNHYFNQRSRSETFKLLSGSNLNTANTDAYFKDIPMSRTSTPISKSSRDISPMMQVPDVAGALPMECNVIKSVTPPQRPAQKKTDKELPCPTSTTITENLTKPNEANITPTVTSPTQNVRPVKQFEFCKFCYKNGELSDVYMSHITKLSDGKIICPILRKYVCDLCGATGDKAHTRKYCSLNLEQNKKQPYFRRLTNGVLTSSHNHK